MFYTVAVKKRRNANHVIIHLFIYLFIWFLQGGRGTFVWKHTSNSVLSFIMKTTLLHPGMFMLHSKTQ